MTISTTQQLDYLWKKLGFGLTKTDNPALKSAFNESIVSPPFMPGNEIWAEAEQIPGIIPGTSSGVVAIYAGTSCIECIMDITASNNRTWLTNLTDWVPPLYGSTYQVKVYLDSTGAANPTVTGTQLYAAGSSPDAQDEWFFDHQSGVLTFIGTNLPPHAFTGKAIYVSGARYVGVKGMNVAATGTFGNLSFTGDTISSTNSIILDPTTANISVSDAIVSNVGYPVSNTDAASVQYVVDQFNLLQSNSDIIQQGNTYVQVNDNPPESSSNVVIVVDDILMATVTNTAVVLNNIPLSSTSTLTFKPSKQSLAVFNSTTALQPPSGSTSQRPSSPYEGLMRFNTDTKTLEYFDGVEWVSLRYQVDSQVIVGNQVDNTFILAYDAIETTILVNINGTVNQPGTAYTITHNSGNTYIVFAEPPSTTDVVEIRFLNLGAVTPPSIIQKVSLANSFGIIVDTDNQPVEVTPSVIDSFDITLYDCAKFVVKAKNLTTNEFQLTEMVAWYVNSTTFLSVGTSTFSGIGEFVSFNVHLAGNQLELLALGDTSNIYLKVYKTYFTI